MPRPKLPKDVRKSVKVTLLVTEGWHERTNHIAYKIFGVSVNEYVIGVIEDTNEQVLADVEAYKKSRKVPKIRVSKPA
jgi:hypothetical protein